METKYKQYLKACGVISEEDFNKIIDSLPEFDIENVSILDYDIDINSFCESVIDHILSRWDYCYDCADVESENKTFYLDGVDSLENLEEINNYFKENSTWTIENYDSLKKYLIETAPVLKENTEKDNLLKIIKRSATTNDLLQIIKEHGY